MQKQEDRQYAGFFVRLAAYFVDYLVAAVLLMFIAVPMGVTDLVMGENILTRPVLFQYSIYAIVVYLIRVLYFTICTYGGGQTIGKKIFNICVVPAGDEELTFLNVLYRESIGRFLSGLILNIGYLMIGPGREKCALHDMLCDTRVIYSVYVRGMKTMPKPGKNRNLNKDLNMNSNINADMNLNMGANVNTGMNPNMDANINTGMNPNEDVNTNTDTNVNTEGESNFGQDAAEENNREK